MPFATITEARDAILGHFVTKWEAQTPPVPKLLYRGVKDDTPPGPQESWARVTVQHNVATQVALGEVGNRRFRKFGLVTVQIFTPLDENVGLSTADRLIQVAIDAFEGETTGGDDTVEFTDVTATEIGPDGAWFQDNVVAQFNYDAVK